MDYIEVRVTSPSDFTDILIAELGECGYEAFVDTEKGFNAYITEDLFSEEDLEAVFKKYSEFVPLTREIQKIEKVNWNEEWEKNFQPLLIADTCSVRASFHPKPGQAEYDIVINPKMSFGTGHHETTTMMIETQLELDHKGKDVLDMGCGTGILAILAQKLGAKSVAAVEIEDWTVENARENAAINDCTEIEVYLGDVNVIKDHDPFDIILANINRNVLLEDLKHYSALLKDNGTLVISGFYKEDLEMLNQEASQHNLFFKSERSLNNWASAVFSKKI